jgi:hypothetical protein
MRMPVYTPKKREETFFEVLMECTKPSFHKGKVEVLVVKAKNRLLAVEKAFQQTTFEHACVRHAIEA